MIVTGFIIGYLTNKSVESKKTVIISERTNREIDNAIWLKYSIEENQCVDCRNFIDSLANIYPAFFYPIQASDSNFKILILPYNYRILDSIIEPYVTYSNEVYMIERDRIYYLKPIPVKIKRE